MNSLNFNMSVAPEDSIFSNEKKSISGKNIQRSKMSNFAPKMQADRGATRKDLFGRITSVEKFFTKRLSEFFRGITFSLKHGEARQVLEKDVSEAVDYINNSSSQKFENLPNAPLLSRGDAAFMKDIKENKSLSGMEMARILDIKDKVKERIGLYHTINMISSNIEAFGVEYSSEKYTLILDAIKKLSGENEEPRPLGNKETRILKSALEEVLKEVDQKEVQKVKPVKETVPLKDKSVSHIDLESYIEKKAAQPKYSLVMDQAKSDYAQIASLYEETEDEVLKLKEGHVEGEVQPKLTKKTLMKVVLKANFILSQKPNEDLGACMWSRKLDWHVLTSREDGNLQIVKWSGESVIGENDQEYLGAGSFGSVQRGHNMATGRSTAVKIASPDPWAKKARVDVINEAAKLRLIHDEGDNDGIQERSDVIFKISNGPQGEPIYGYTGQLYNKGSLESFSKSPAFTNLPLKEKIKMTLSLLKGLKKLQTPTNERGCIVHGDIKPGNIFVHQKKDGSYEFRLGDLGDSKDLTNELPWDPKRDNFPGTVCSPGYLTKTDYCLLANSSDQKEWERYQAKRDVFALACTIWEAMIGDYVYELDGTNVFADTSRGIASMSGLKEFDSLFGEEFTDIFIKALSEYPNRRPSIDEMIAAVEKRLKY